MPYHPRSPQPPGLNYKCPACGEGTGVVDSRPNEHGIRRRRKCYSCAHKITTIEIPYQDFRDLDLEELRHQVVEDMNRMVASYGKLNRAIKTYTKRQQDDTLQTFQKP